MASPMRNLLTDPARYLQSFRLFLAKSTEHQSMQEFVERQLPAVIDSIGNRKSTINILSIGGGAGEIDLLIISKVQARYPGVTINNDVVEPSADQISKYKERVAKTSNLENVKFTWHEETAYEFESRMNAEKKPKKWDFIHMIQMLYYVKDIPATVRYFHSLLETQAKLLIILVSDLKEMLCGLSSKKMPEQGKGQPFNAVDEEPVAGKRYGRSTGLLSPWVISAVVSSADMKKILDSAGLKYQLHDVPSHMDITSCFIEGDKDGELLLDFLTETYEFSKNAPPELKRQVMEELRKPQCSEERDGKVVFNNNLGAIVVEP